MHFILAGTIGVLTSAGVWLLLRPRSFQVIMGLSLLSYAVNLFLFVMGRPQKNAIPIFDNPKMPLENYADPVPQSLVLTAIVISFATTALVLVILLVARGLRGSDHVDGKREDEERK